MGDYKGQLTAQHYEDRVATIRTDLGDVPEESRRLLEDTDPNVVERLGVLLDHLLVLTSTLSAEVVPTDKPGHLSTALDELKTNIGYLAEPANAPSYVPNVIAAINNLAAVLWTWQGSSSASDWRDAVTEAASTYRRSLGQQLVSARDELDGLATSIEKAKTGLSDLREKGEQFESSMGDELEALKDRSTERLAALEAQIEALGTQVTAAVARQDASIQQYQEQFSTAQEKRTTDFAELVQSARSEAAETRKDLDTAGKQSLAELQAQIDKAKDMVSVFSAGGTANAFGKEAKEQSGAANTWRIIAIVLAIVGAAAAGVLMLAFGNRASTPELVGKLAVTVVIAGAAGYAATQSSAHRKREVRNRRAELLLASFEPFARDLPIEERNTARVALLQVLMSDDPTGAADDEESVAFSAGQMNFIKQLIDFARSGK